MWGDSGHNTLLVPFSPFSAVSGPKRIILILTRRVRLCAEVCPYKKKCSEFLQSLGIHHSYFLPAFDRCYCQICAGKVRMPDVLERDWAHGCPYEVPKGWCVRRACQRVGGGEDREPRHEDRGRHARAHFVLGRRGSLCVQRSEVACASSE